MVLRSRVNCMSSSSLSPLAAMRICPPLTETSWMACRPRSSVVKKSELESGDQVKLLTHRSSVSVKLVSLPVARSVIVFDA